MSNFWTIVFVFFLFAAISFISLELGLTTTTMTALEAPDTGGDITALEALAYAVRFVVNNVGSFFQIITFQTSLPNALNVLVIAPIGFGMLYIGVVIVRGGAG